MRFAARWCGLVGLVAVVAVFLASVALAADSPKVSTFAPAKDLVAQVDYYVERLENAVKDESEYKDSKDKIVKDANTLAVLALTLGLSDEDNNYKKAAPGLVKASQKLCAAKDFAAAKAGVAGVKGALSSSGDASGMKWEKVASLEALMAQVPLVNSRLKRNVGGIRFAKMAKENAGGSAALAAIAQASMANADDVKKLGDAEKWNKFCAEMRDAAGALNAAIHGKDKDAAGAAMKKLAKSCDDCHEVFHPEEAK